MADRGGQPGNTNATKNRVWSLAIEKALKLEYGRKATLDNLIELAKELITLCKGGDLGSLKELGDRMEGKAHQSVSSKIDIVVDVRNSEEVPFAGIREKAEKAKEKIH